MLRSRMLLYVALNCCDRLAGISNLKMVKCFMQHLWILHVVLVFWSGLCNNVGPMLVHSLDLQIAACCNRVTKGMQLSGA